MIVTLPRCGTILVLTLAISTAFPATQHNDIVGDFTKSPTEHIIIELQEPFFVRSVKGSVLLKNSCCHDPLPGILFEIQGPGVDKRIQHGRTDEHGQFHIGHVPQGTYKFKATLNGYQSVMGTIVVSKKAGRDDIKIEMPVGV